MSPEVTNIITDMAFWKGAQKAYSNSDHLCKSIGLLEADKPTTAKEYECVLYVRMNIYGHQVSDDISMKVNSVDAVVYNMHCIRFRSREI